ncbi:uncharacterized protein [Haliotis cracherodii]|uniref:uncharacterized protein n=1 Tax=Haliotis cracherodii TaxID=6455 RepID=UPI0039EBB1AA
MATGRTTSKSQSTHYSITKHMRTTSQTLTSSRKTMSEKSDTSESTYGVFIAVGIGSTVLLTAIVVLCLLRRKGRCFKRKDNMQQIRINGTAQVHGMGHETAEYSVIGGITNTCGLKSTDCPSIDPSTCITQNTRPDNSTTDPGKTGECDYNILQARTQHAVPETRGNPYSHLTGPDRFTCKGDYDTAEHIKASRTTGLDITVAHTGPAVRRQTCDEEGQYNVLRHYTSQGRDGADAGVYDHVGSGEGDYDTTHPIKNPREDDAYSHIVKVNN